MTVHLHLSWLREPVEARWKLDVHAAWFDWPAPLRPLPAKLAITAKKTKAHALKLDGGFVLRRAAFAGIELPLRDLDGEFSLLDVRDVAPLDRSSAKVEWRNGYLSRLRVAKWSAPRTPPFELFRIGEVQEEVMVSEALGAAIQRASGGLLGVREVSEAELSQRAVHTFHPDGGHPEVKRDDAAEAAFWAAVRGEKVSRATVCRSAEWAYWLARVVDRKLKPDTVKAVATHPLFAALAAIAFSDARVALRAACARDWWAARAFSMLVAGEVPKAFEKTLTDAGYDLEQEREAARELLPG